MHEFDDSGLARGKHHWDDKRWVFQVELFMDRIQFGREAPLDVFKTMVMVSSTKISKKTPP